MKILKANIYFILPEDFDGTANEALELWALHKDHSSQQLAPPQETEVTAHAVITNSYFGYRTAFEVGIFEGKEGDWKGRFEEVSHASRSGNLVFK